MSFAITNQILNSTLPAGLQHTLAVFGTFADAGGLCWPSNETVAKRSNKDERTVRRHVDELVGMGIIERIYRKGKTAITRIILTALSGYQTPDILPPQPRTFCPPESVTEPVNEITALPTPPVLAEVPAVAAIVFENKQQQPEAQQPAPVEALPEPIEAATAPEALPTLPEAATEPLKAFEALPNELLHDFGVVRKQKRKAPAITRTEAAVFASEAKKAGLSVAEAVTACIHRGWARFEAHWLPAPAKTTPPAAPTPYRHEVQVPARPEVVAAGRAALAELRAKIIAQKPHKGLSVLT